MQSSLGKPRGCAGSPCVSTRHQADPSHEDGSRPAFANRSGTRCVCALGAERKSSGVRSPPRCWECHSPTQRPKGAQTPSARWQSQSGEAMSTVAHASFSTIPPPSPMPFDVTEGWPSEASSAGLSALRTRSRRPSTNTGIRLASSIWPYRPRPRTCSRSTPGSQRSARTKAEGQLQGMGQGRPRQGLHRLGNARQDAGCHHDIRMGVYVRIHLWVEAVMRSAQCGEASYFQVANKFLPTLQFDPVELRARSARNGSWGADSGRAAIG